jgi:hypothetical protein
MAIQGKLLVVLGLILLLPTVFALEPSGAAVANGTSTTAPADTAYGNNAIAGNITELGISGFTTTQTWQGYFGNITGVIQLADSNDNVLYNWSQASPRGEVYASTNQSVQWLNIQCLNFSSVGDYTAEAGLGGTTSLYGTNLSQIHSQYGIDLSDPDSVNATFNLLGAGTHDAFFTASQQFDEGECQSTRVYDNTGIGVTNIFEEALLYEPVTSSVVFASIIEQDVTGFDSASHDFEMLVLENGHGIDIAPTPYYFFVELQ